MGSRYPFSSALSGLFCPPHSSRFDRMPPAVARLTRREHTGISREPLPRIIETLRGFRGIPQRMIHGLHSCDARADVRKFNVGGLNDRIRIYSTTSFRRSLKEWSVRGGTNGGNHALPSIAIRGQSMLIDLHALQALYTCGSPTIPLTLSPSYMMLPDEQGEGPHSRRLGQRKWDKE